MILKKYGKGLHIAVRNSNTHHHMGQKPDDAENHAPENIKCTLSCHNH